MRELLFLKPIFKEILWGGDRLNTQYGYQIPSSHTGECWAVSAHPHGDCSFDGGSFDGKPLSWLWRTHPEIFGSFPGEEFPLLVKIIDAKDDLSIQVHPDDDYARTHERGSLGKTECWYILDCDENAEIIIGHHAKTRPELEEMIHEKKWPELIRRLPIKKGDFFQINPGCIHAIKGGTLIFETQQNSDITYRVYDYERLSNGEPRLLHVGQSIDTIMVPHTDPLITPLVSHSGDAVITQYLSCPYYTISRIDIHGEYQQQFFSSFTNVSVLDGEGSINTIPLKKGMHFIIPYHYGICQFQGSLQLMCSSPDSAVV